MEFNLADRFEDVADAAGYLGDPGATAATFVEAGGRRWALPGDLATVESDGTIVVLGRGALSINTGGEKVFPDEVEAVLKGHPSVTDAIVVGVPDERFGERVAAVVRFPSGKPDIRWARRVAAGAAAPAAAAGRAGG